MWRRKANFTVGLLLSIGHTPRARRVAANRKRAMSASSMTWNGMPTVLSADVRAAVASVVQGVSFEFPLAQSSLNAAHAQMPCLSHPQLKLCVSNGTATWQREAATPVTLRHRWELDTLLLPRAKPYFWSTVANHGETRLMSTTHYMSDDQLACAGAAPFVLRVHSFCGTPDAPAARLRAVGRVRAAATSGSTPSWLLTRPSVESGTMPASYKCELETFLEAPTLCTASAVHGDPRPRRLQHLLQDVWGARPERSGYVARGAGAGLAASALGPPRAGGGGEPSAADTYGELSAEGILRLLEALREADEDAFGLSRPPPSSADANGAPPAPGLDALGEGHTFLDVGSGVGKAVMAVAMLTNASAVGVEYVHERASRAAAALEDALALRLMAPEEAARVSLLERDATQPGALAQATTHAYLANLCFPRELTLALVRRLQQLPHLRCVGSLRQLPETAQEAEADDGVAEHEALPCARLRLVRSLRVPMSWDDHTRMYIHCCDRPSAA